MRPPAVLEGALSGRLRLAIEAQLFSDSDNGIADLVDGALQLALCHTKMLEPVTNLGLNLHRDVAAVALAFAGKNIAHELPDPGLKSIRGARDPARVGPANAANIDDAAKPHHVFPQ
jgi:hypothetical protein